MFNLFGSGHHVRHFILSNNLEALRMLDLELLICGSKEKKIGLKYTIALIVRNMKSLKKVRIAFYEPKMLESEIIITTWSVMKSLKLLAKLSLKESAVVMRNKMLEKFAQVLWNRIWSMQDIEDGTRQHADLI